MDSFKSEGHVRKISIFPKGEFPQAIGIRLMEMWSIVPANNFIVPVIHIQIDLGGDVLINIIDFFTMMWRNYLQVRNWLVIHWLQ